MSGSPAVQLSLLEAAPDAAAAAVGAPETVYGHQANSDFGHLLIAADRGGDWLFLNLGGPFIRCCLPGWDTAVDLDADQLRVLGDYCLRQARRLGKR